MSMALANVVPLKPPLVGPTTDVTTSVSLQPRAMILLLCHAINRTRPSSCVQLRGIISYFERCRLGASKLAMEGIYLPRVLRMWSTIMSAPRSAGMHWYAQQCTILTLVRLAVS